MITDKQKSARKAARTRAANRAMLKRWRELPPRKNESEIEVGFMRTLLLLLCLAAGTMAKGQELCRITGAQEILTGDGVWIVCPQQVWDDDLPLSSRPWPQLPKIKALGPRNRKVGQLLWGGYMLEGSWPDGDEPVHGGWIRDLEVRQNLPVSSRPWVTLPMVKAQEPKKF